ncbi:hypothetical protein [Rhodococcus sp. IEGM 1379]|uniref:hypothetical protein n=1 Tax=Rhodococcus sp. IEGM 1379 TaxID=3047086 RepID=UPI0024B730A9|nr:hypothetical protein [Rhodococcus sp. IEGM 1379]MDI9915763.1 hypothetical protein [Rhodococcus sp. IEGM 1379]
MSIVNEATRVVTGAARMTTSAVGAVGGGVVGGVSGGIRGAAGGVRDGIRAGAKSTPTAVLTLAAVGAAGLVEWPVLVAVGGTAVVLRELDRKDHAAVGAGNNEHEQHPRKSEKPVARTSHKSQSAS